MEINESGPETNGSIPELAISVEEFRASRIGKIQIFSHSQKWLPGLAKYKHESKENNLWDKQLDKM